MTQQFLKNNCLFALAGGLLFALCTGCRTSVNDAVITYGHDPILQNGAIIVAAAPIYVAGGRVPDGPAILRTGTLKEISDEATATARGDIASGRPRVAWTGGFASQPVGIPFDKWYLIKKLPTVPLPTGCTEPNLKEAAVYAEAYNKEILAYLLNKTESQKSIH